MSSPTQFLKAIVDSPPAAINSKTILDNKRVFKLAMPKGKVVTQQTYHMLSTLEKKIAEAVIGAMREVMSNDKSSLKGVWYPEDLDRFYARQREKMPQDHYEGYLSSTYFQKTGKFTWVLKEGESAAEAIKALFHGPSVLDCGNAIHACYYKALLEIFGEEKFEFYFSGPLHRRLAITTGGAGSNDNPLYAMSCFWFKEERRQKGSKEMQYLTIGEDCHISGLPFYREKHPKGFGGGWNVIYVGKNNQDKQLFIGHGLDRALTEMEIITMLIDSYNEERTAEEEEFIRKSDCKLYDKNENPMLKKYYTIQADTRMLILSYLKKMGKIGFKIESVKSLHVAKIATLIEELHLVQSLEKLFLKR